MEILDFHFTRLREDENDKIEDFGLSQEESDEKLEVRRQAIYQIEKGLRTPGIKFIKNTRCF